MGSVFACKKNWFYVPLHLHGHRIKTEGTSLSVVVQLDCLGFTIYIESLYSSPKIIKYHTQVYMRTY
jgi:hypothetical protein